MDNYNGPDSSNDRDDVYGTIENDNANPNEPQGQNGSYNEPPYGQNNTYDQPDPRYQGQGSYQNNNNYNPYSGPGMQNPQNHYQQGPPAANGKAIASLVLGIISIISCACYPLGIVLSIIGIVLAILSRDSNKKMSGIAKAGLITSIIGLLFCVMILVTWQTGGASDLFWNTFYDELENYNF